MATILHRTENLVPIDQIEPGSWVWDDRNDEPALFEGWWQSARCYIAEWLTGGLFCLFDLDGNGRPVRLEVLRVEEQSAG